MTVEFAHPRCAWEAWYQLDTVSLDHKRIEVKWSQRKVERGRQNARVGQEVYLMLNSPGNDMVHKGWDEHCRDEGIETNKRGRSTPAPRTGGKGASNAGRKGKRSFTEEDANGRQLVDATNDRFLPEEGVGGDVRRRR